jgi:hypothetical protein
VLLEEHRREPLQVQRPTVVAADALTDAFPPGAVTLEVAVFEVDPSALGGLGGEPHLDLTGLVEVGLDLPLRADVPADHDPMRWLVGEHPGEAALAAVDAAVVEASADAGLEHGRRELDLEQVVLARLEAPESFREDLEGALDRRLDDDRRPNRRRFVDAHRPSLVGGVGCSTATL